MWKQSTAPFLPHVVALLLLLTGVSITFYHHGGISELHFLKQPSKNLSLQQLCQAQMTTANPIVKRMLSRPLMVYVGSSTINQPGFMSFQQTDLDITIPEQFASYFCKQSVDVFFSEHTIEHIPEAKHVGIFKTMRDYLKPGGIVRIAIPAYPPNHVPSELDVKYNHVAFPTVETLEEHFRQAQFAKVTRLEYLVHNETFHGMCSMPFDSCAGRVRRSFRLDSRNSDFLQEKWMSLRKTEFNGIAGVCFTADNTPPMFSTIVEARK